MDRTLTSIQSPLVKTIRALGDRRQREHERRLVIEGVRMLEEALDAGVALEVLLYDPAIHEQPRAARVLDRAREANVRLVPALARVIAACSQVKTPQGLLAVVKEPQATLAAVLTEPGLLLIVADRLRDPGNLGTLIRLADAAGATAVAVTAGSVDLYNPKVVRATMGSIFHLPVMPVTSPAAISALHVRGVRVLAADQEGTVDYTEADYRSPVALVVGNEGEGLDAQWAAAATARIRIPLYGRADSLNVAVAAGILLYEARRRSH